MYFLNFIRPASEDIIGKFFLVKLWTVAGRWTHLIYTQSYAINPVFIFILERRKVRWGSEVTCPISHWSVGAGIGHMQSDPKTQSDLDSAEEIHLRRTFAQGHTNSNASQWSTAARWSPSFCPSPSSIWLWGHGPITSAIWAHGMNVHCWMTQLSWQCVKAHAKCWGN